MNFSSHCPKMHGIYSLCFKTPLSNLYLSYSNNHFQLFQFIYMRMDSQHLFFWVSTILQNMFPWSIHFSTNNRMAFFGQLDSIPLCIIYHSFFLSIGTYLCILNDACFSLYISLFMYIKYKFDVRSAFVCTLLLLVNI